MIAQAIVDTYGQERYRAKVIYWLNSPDFIEVCDYANVNCEQMRKQIASICTLPPPLAKKYGKMLRDQIMFGVFTAETK